MMKHSLVFLFLISLSFNLCLASTKRSTSTSTSTSATTFIKKCCTTTTYPTLCYATLSGYSAQIQNKPKRLATKSLVIALIEAKSVAQTMARLSKAHGLRSNEKAALSDCTTAVAGSSAQLQRSILEMGQGPHVAGMEASDVQTWTSTALTYAGTCNEAFEGSDSNGNVKIVVQRKVLKLSQLTSNALALVKRYYVSIARKARHDKNHP